MNKVLVCQERNVHKEMSIFMKYIIEPIAKTHGKDGHYGAWPSKRPGKQQVLETGGTRSVASARVLQEPLLL